MSLLVHSYLGTITNELSSNPDYLGSRIQEMTKFDYAQSNSLLKREIGGATSSTGSSPQAPPPPPPMKRTSRRQPHLPGRDERPAEGLYPSRSMISHNNYHMSSSAAVASADTTAAGAISAALHAGNQSSAAEKKKLKPVTTKKIIHTKHKITTTRMGFTDAESIANENSEKNQKKGRSRKPRRIIPNEKEYIPEDEQPTARDIVGGRGGE